MFGVFAFKCGFEVDSGLSVSKNVFLNISERSLKELILPFLSYVLNLF